MAYTVHARGISKSYNGVAALAGVDLDVETGTVVALLGPNGAGKTTMIRILATQTRPDRGTVTVAGHDLAAEPGAVKRAISLTGQYAAVDDLLTGEENLRMMARLRRLSRREVPGRVDHLLAEFDLDGVRNRRVATYSGGLRRRLDLAMSMVVAPELLFLDEPTTGLDPRSREQLWATVRRLVGDGVTVLLTTQYLEEADQLADRIVMIDRGRVVSEGRAADLKARVGTEVIRLEFTDRRDFERTAGEVGGGRGGGVGVGRGVGVGAWRGGGVGVGPAGVGVGRVDEAGMVVELATDGTAEHVQRTLSRLVGRSEGKIRVSIDRPTLDDVFLSMTEEVA